MQATTSPATPRNTLHSAEYQVIMPVEDDATRRPTAVCLSVYTIQTQPKHRKCILM